MTTISAAPELELDRGFVVASGIECSAPLIEGGRRQDELVKTGHRDRVEEDLALVASFGIRYLRYGVPFHAVGADPATFDWGWTDRAMAALRANGIEPIVDLLHYGLPDDLWGFGDERFPDRFTAYATAFAERYPWVRYYTPVNEPLVGATFAARFGWWNERRTDDDSYVAAIERTSTAIVLASNAIRDRRPDALFIQSDACEGYVSTSRAAAPLADLLNARRFLGWDLVYGRRPDPIVTDWLARHGLGEERLAWFAEHGSADGAIVGHDYYIGNEWLVDEDGTTRSAAGRRRGYAALAREYHEHFGLPFMLSETNIEGPGAPAWLAEVWNETLGLRLEGLPVRGFTWYGFIDHVDWDTCLREAAERPNPCGLVDLDRRPHAVGARYRELALAALHGDVRPLPRASAGATYQSGRPSAAGEEASGPTVVSGDASA